MTWVLQSQHAGIHATGCWEVVEAESVCRCASYRAVGSFVSPPRPLLLHEFGMADAKCGARLLE